MEIGGSGSVQRVHNKYLDVSTDRTHVMAFSRVANLTLNDEQCQLS